MGGWGLSETTPPAEAPVSLAEAKLHLRVDASDDDALITSLIEAATDAAQKFTNRQLVTATYVLTLDEWPVGDRILIPRPPLASVLSVVYTKSDDTTATVPSDDYFADTSDPDDWARLVLHNDAAWPTAQLRPAAAVAVTYTAGYGAASDVPDVFKTAIKLTVGSLYENRESVVVGTIAAKVPHSVEWLLYPHRVWR